MCVGVQSAQNCRTTGRAKAGGAEHVLEVQPFGRQRIDVRRFQMRMPRTGKGIPTNVIAKHDNDVGTFFSLSRPGGMHRENQKQTEQGRESESHQVRSRQGNFKGV